MIENRAEQKEVLEALVELNTGLVKNMTIVVKELSGARMDDTDVFLGEIIKAINWEIQAMNGTMELLNEDKVRIDKEAFNAKVIAVNDAVMAKDDAKMAAAFTELIPVFEALGKAAEEVIA